MQINGHRLGHTFHIQPGDAYSLGNDDGTFAVLWADLSITTFRVVDEDNGCIEYGIAACFAEDCTADLTRFKPFFREALDEDGFSTNAEGEPYSDMIDSPMPWVDNFGRVIDTEERNDFTIDEDGRVYADGDDAEDDSWSDGDSLASAGHGMDEDYGYCGDDY